jgi:hypothetical protein
MTTSVIILASTSKNMLRPGFVINTRLKIFGPQANLNNVEQPEGWVYKDKRGIFMQALDNSSQIAITEDQQEDDVPPSDQSG